VFTRCRPYQKNDQAWVEQRNGAVVRRIVGYRRFTGLDAAATPCTALQSGAVVRELLPALLQAGAEVTSKGEGAEESLSTSDALPTAAR
jgi:hypothetical protein